jgi:acyl dehydratase
VYFDEFSQGDVFEFGSYQVSEDEIIEFARKYDPQSFHTDPEAARAGPFRGLIASGFHTAAIMMRMMVEDFVDPRSALGSPGLRDLRWTAPVHPGDVLKVRLSIEKLKTSQSQPDRGFVDQKVQLLNQRGEVVLSCVGVGIYRKSPSAEARNA